MLINLIPQFILPFLKIRTPKTYAALATRKTRRPRSEWTPTNNKKSFWLDLSTTSTGCIWLKGWLCLLPAKKKVEDSHPPNTTLPPMPVNLGATTGDGLTPDKKITSAQKTGGVHGRGRAVRGVWGVRVCIPWVTDMAISGRTGPDPCAFCVGEQRLSARGVIQVYWGTF